MEELVKYVENSSKTFSEKIEFLLKVWNSNNLPTSTKYQVTTECFNKFLKLWLKSLRKENILDVPSDEMSLIISFLRMKHPSQSVTKETKLQQLEQFKSVLLMKSSKLVLEGSLVLLAHENMKEIFKQNLTEYFAFIFSMLESFGRFIEGSEVVEVKVELWMQILNELYSFCKMPKYQELFLSEVFDQLAKISDELTKCLKGDSVHNQKLLDLLNTIYYSQISLAPESEEVTNYMIFDTNVNSNQFLVLCEAFIATNRTKPVEVTKFFKFVYQQKIHDLEGEEYLNKIERLFTVLKKYDLDRSSMKRALPETFTHLEKMIRDTITSQTNQMSLNKFLSLVTSFVTLDPFLFESNIYEIIAECMFKDKNLVEMESYQELLKIVLKVYGKDVIQFLINLMEAVDDQLETVDTKLSLNPSGKRKNFDSETPPKKMKTSKKGRKSMEQQVETINHIWPTEITENQFADIVSGLNVKQSIKLLKMLTKFLNSNLVSLKDLKEDISVHLFFKIEFVCSLLGQFLLASRLHEHQNKKFENISEAISKFHQAQHEFYSILLNIEYNNRLVNIFLQLSHNYENFHFLFFYHLDSEAKDFLTSSKTRMDEWKIIRQRINNFGKSGEKDSANLLALQQQQKQILFGDEKVKTEDFLAMLLEDSKQVEFVLSKKEIKPLFLQLLESDAEQMATFCKFLIENPVENSNVLPTISSSPSLLDSFMKHFLNLVASSDSKLRHNFNDSTKFEVVLNILTDLPLGYIRVDYKKNIFAIMMTMQKMLNESCEKNKSISRVISLVFKGEGYKNFFKDYDIKEILAVFKDIKDGWVYESIISSMVRKLNVNTLDALKWITSNLDKVDSRLGMFLLDKIMKAFSEPNISLNLVTPAEIKTFKSTIMMIILEQISKAEQNGETLPTFVVVLKDICTFKDLAVLEEPLVNSLTILLAKFIKFANKKPNNENSVELLITTLKNAKLLKLKEETTNEVIKVLSILLNDTIKKKISGGASESIEREKLLMNSLKGNKANCGDESFLFMHKILSSTPNLTANNLSYAFQLLQVIFENNLEAGSNTTQNKKRFGPFLDQYKIFCAEFLLVAFKVDEDKKVGVFCQIMETSLAILKVINISLENDLIDELLFFVSEAKCVQPKDVEDFCRFYGYVGEILFVLAANRQSYFTSRIPQYLNVYKTYLDTVYSYKTEEKDDLSFNEIELLLKLTLKAENIMRTIISFHLTSMKVIAPYIVTQIANIFVKNPKTLAKHGDKFQVNLKNVCHQLMTTFEYDEKTLRFVYSVSNETTKDVLAALINEFKKKWN